MVDAGCGTFEFWFSRSQENLLRCSLRGLIACGTKEAMEQIVALFKCRKALSSAEMWGGRGPRPPVAWALW